MEYQVLTNLIVSGVVGLIVVMGTIGYTRTKTNRKRLKMKNSMYKYNLGRVKS